MARYIVDGSTLRHYGIKGMRWGIRRKDPGTSGVNGNSQKKGGPKDKWGRSTKKTANTKYVRGLKSVKTMSDAELKSRVQRIELEKQYNNLVKKDREALAKGANFVGGILANVVTNVATTYATDAFMGSRGNRGKWSPGPTTHTVEQIQLALTQGGSSGRALRR